MLTSIIGYTLTGLFGGFSALMVVEMFKRAKNDPSGSFVALFLFIIFGLLSLGTAYVAGL